MSNSRDAWEYIIVRLVGADDIEPLQEAGMDGWELISVASDEQGFVAFMKREIY